MAVEYTVSSDFYRRSCADPGVGVQLWQLFFKVNEGSNTAISGPPTTCQRNATWRFAGGPMVAQHWMLDLYICSFVIFQGIRTSIALETLYFWFFSTGGRGPDPLSPMAFVNCRALTNCWFAVLNSQFLAGTPIFWRRLYSFVWWDSHFLEKRALGLLFSKS